MPSIDIVSRTDLQEVEDAINGLRQEIALRFDFKDPGCAPERKDAPNGLPVGVVEKVLVSRFVVCNRPTREKITPPLRVGHLLIGMSDEELRA